MRDRKSASVRDEAGQATSEYALLIALGAVAVIAALLFLAGSIDGLLTATSNATSTFRPPDVQCEAGYADVCIPPAPPDLDCSDLAALGIPLPVRVVGDDPHGLDDNGDGFGC